MHTEGRTMFTGDSKNAHLTKSDKGLDTVKSHDRQRSEGPVRKAERRTTKNIVSNVFFRSHATF